MATTRIERDTMGEMEVPADALYGASTARAVANFPVSGETFPSPFLIALAMIKEEAAGVNRDLGLLDAEKATAIRTAAGEVRQGRWDDQFVVDIFQTGSGTSTNTNANEVIATRASQLIGGDHAVHPNDHVNLGQSSNDVIPTTLQLAAAREMTGALLPALATLGAQLSAKAKEFDDIVTIGRTHLQDATPLRLGQIFGGYARQVALAAERIAAARDGLCELPLGGTAVGTGINTHPEFAAKVIAKLAQATELPLREAENHFEAQGGRDAAVAASGALKSTATALFKIANDIRFLGSGPRCGLGELRLPAVQPGSSIMPGKVNPVMAESLLQVCAQVVGNDAAITLGGLSGNFELNVMMPLIARNLLSSIRLLSCSVTLFAERCIAGLEADRERCAALVEQSLAMVTALAPVLGYDQAAALAKEAHASGKTIREVVQQRQLLPEGELAAILDPWPMTEPGIPGRTR